MCDKQVKALRAIAHIGYLHGQCRRPGCGAERCEDKEMTKSISNVSFGYDRSTFYCFSLLLSA